jgi:NTP pyrophosphatase (non-canonical NTP hydrolase)
MPNETPGPYSIGSHHWPGLSKLIEECGEVMQVAGKLIGSGGDPMHWDGTDLRERLLDELSDLQAALRFFGTMNYEQEAANRFGERVEAKVALFHEWHGTYESDPFGDGAQGPLGAQGPGAGPT